SLNRAKWWVATRYFRLSYHLPFVRGSDFWLVHGMRAENVVVEPGNDVAVTSSVLVKIRSLWRKLPFLGAPISEIDKRIHCSSSKSVESLIVISNNREIMRPC